MSAVHRNSNANDTPSSSNNHTDTCISADPLALPSTRGFKLALLNINNLLAHLDELKIYLADNDIDILSINESKLNDCDSDEKVRIPGYEIVRRDRTTDGGGGVCFYIKSSIKFSKCPELRVEALENLCIKITNPRSKPFIVATWYRPPDSLVGLFPHFETLIKRLDSLDMEYFLLGDLNCDMAAPVHDNHTRHLTNITDVYGLKQLITEPTRITETTATLLDVIFTNVPDNIVCSGVRHIGISDHIIVFAYRNVSSESSRDHSYLTYRNFRNFDRDSFRKDVASQDWDRINIYNDPNRMWHEWKEQFMAIVDSHAPSRTIRVRERVSPWITPKLKQIMRNRDALKLKAIRSKTPSDWK